MEPGNLKDAKLGSPSCERAQNSGLLGGSVWNSVDAQGGSCPFKGPFWVEPFLENLGVQGSPSSPFFGLVRRMDWHEEWAGTRMVREGYENGMDWYGEWTVTAYESKKKKALLTFSREI